MSASRVGAIYCYEARVRHRTPESQKNSLARDLFKVAQKVLFDASMSRVHKSNLATCYKKCTLKRAKHLKAFKTKLAFFFQEQLYSDSGEVRLDALQVFPQLKEPMQDFLTQADDLKLSYAFSAADLEHVIFRDSPLPSLSLFALVHDTSNFVTLDNHIYKTPGHCPGMKTLYPYRAEDRFDPVKAGKMDPGLAQVHSNGIVTIRNGYQLLSTQEGLFTVPLYPANPVIAAKSIVTGEEYDLIRSSAGLFLTIPTEPFVPFVRQLHLQAFVSFVFAHKIHIGEDKTGLPELVLKKIHDFVANREQKEEEEQ